MVRHGARRQVCIHEYRHSRAYSTDATAINNQGQIVGCYTLALGGASHGFLRQPDGYYSFYDAPGSVMTCALGINDAGIIVGEWSPGLSAAHSNGFIRSADGAFTTADPFGSTSATITSISGAGDMVLNASIQFPFNATLLETANLTTYQAITVPTAIEAFVFGINNEREIVGGVYTPNTGSPSFLVEQAFRLSFDTGAAVIFSVPGSSSATVADAVNNRGDIVGYYGTGVDGEQRTHGLLVDRRGGFVAIDGLGNNGTVLTGINDAGQIVGRAAAHAFLADPIGRITPGPIRESWR